ncbi:MAG: hypothetical protein V1701_06375 [Planctomycetota bacterium]
MNELKWTAHPVKQNPVKSAFLIVMLLLLILLVYILFESILTTAISGLLLFGSLYKFFIPTSYTLTETELIVETPSGRKATTWDMFKSYYPDQNGILLSPYPGKSRLESFRGIYLINPQNRAEVIAFLERKIKRLSASRPTGQAEQSEQNKG